MDLEGEMIEGEAMHIGEGGVEGEVEGYWGYTHYM